jgi:hypothetical protein
VSYATLVGYTVVRDTVGAAAYYTPPMASEAKKASFSLEATHFYGAGALIATVEHKNLDETTWATAGTFADITGAGVKTLVIDGVKEEFRFKFGFSGGGAGDFVHLLIAAVMWLLD